MVVHGSHAWVGAGAQDALQRACGGAAKCACVGAAACVWRCRSVHVCGRDKVLQRACVSAG
eukprot:268481-Chlamydomonas_euryale.AAC.1